MPASPFRHLVLVRHGESALNASNRAGGTVLCGQFDTPLTDRGRQQARDVGLQLARRDDLQLARAISSALSRARDTLDLILGQLPASVVALPPAADLNERSLGDFEGLSDDDVYQRFPAYRDDERFNRFRQDFVQKAPGGENLAEVAHRAWRHVELLLAAQSDDVLLISHAMTIRCIVGKACGTAGRKWCDLRVQNSLPIVLRAERTQTEWAGRMELLVE